MTYEELLIEADNNNLITKELPLPVSKGRIKGNCIISNGYWFFKSQKLYKRFLSGKEMSSYIPEVDELFKKAGTSYKSMYDELNYRTFRDVAYLCDRKKYDFEVNKVFLITIGTFRTRLKRSIIPAHLFFLPSYFLETKEVKVPSIFKLILTGVYWVISSVAAYHLDALLDFVYLEYLQSIFERIL